MTDVETMKAELRQTLSEREVDALELLIDFKMAEMLNELSKRLENANKQF